MNGGLFLLLASIGFGVIVGLTSGQAPKLPPVTSPPLSYDLERLKGPDLPVLGPIQPNIPRQVLRPLTLTAVEIAHGEWSNLQRGQDEAVVCYWVESDRAVAGPICITRASWEQLRQQ